MSKTTDVVEELIPSLSSRNPSLPPNVHSIPIHPVSLYDGAPLSSAHVFPSPLDIDRLRKSIQALSSIMPTIASRYVVTFPPADSPTPRYELHLSQSLIPFSYQSLDIDEPFPENGQHITQPSFHPFSPAFNEQALWPNTNLPLFALRYTQFASGKSMLVVGLVHILADAATHHTIVKMLSDIYQADGDTDLIDPTNFPVFDIGLPPLASPVQLPPELPFVCSSTLFQPSSFPPPAGDFKTIQLDLMPLETAALKAECMTSAPKTISHLSTLDVLTGWLCGLPLRNHQSKVDMVIYTVDMRAIGAAPANFAGNAVLTLDINTVQLGLQGHGEDSPGKENTRWRVTRAAFVASKIREAITLIRTERDMVSDWIKISAHYLEDAILRKEKPPMTFANTTIFLNSYLHKDWAIAFGHPKDEVKFYFSQALEEQPRIYKSHWRKGQSEAERWVAVEFNVDAADYERTLLMIRRDRSRWRGAPR